MSRFVVVGRKLCSECQRVKKELTDAGHEVDYYELDDFLDLSIEVRARLSEQNDVLPVVIERKVQT